MQQLLLVYDIENDRIRTKIANLCQDFGLDRIQYSTFSGRLSRNQQEALMLKIEDVLEREAGSICLFPISAKEWDQRLEVENV